MRNSTEFSFSFTYSHQFLLSKFMQYTREKCEFKFKHFIRSALNYDSYAMLRSIVVAVGCYEKTKYIYFKLMLLLLEPSTVAS